MDFFESIESAQTTMFNPSNDSPTTQYFQQQATFNPFLQQQQQQPMGMMPTGMGGYGGGLVPQATGMGYAAFGGQQQQMGNQFGGPPPFLNQQPTASPFLRQTFPPQFPQQSPPFAQPSPFGQGIVPQMTEYPMAMQQQPMMTGQPNPFRQSMMPTGSPFGQQQNQPFGLMAPPSSAPSTATPSSPFSTTSQPFPQPNSNSTPSSPFPQSNGSPFAKPLASQPTGSRNPFAPAVGERAAPPEPSGPSLNSMGGNAFGASQQYQANQALGGSSSQPSSNQNQPQAQQQTQNQNNAFPSSSLNNSFGFGAGSGSTTQQSAGLTPAKTGTMGSVASEFALASRFPPSTSSTPPPPVPTFNGNNLPQQISSLSLNSTSTNPPSFPSGVSNGTGSSYLSNQSTGYTPSGLSKPFTPTSSFGTSLQESLGPSSLVAQQTGFNPFRATGGTTSPGVNGGLGNAFGGGGFAAGSNGFNAGQSNGNGNGDGTNGGYGAQGTGSLI